MVFAALVTFVPIVTCWFLLRRSTPQKSMADRAVDLSLAVACGFAIVGFFYLACRVFIGSVGLWLAGVELAGCATAVLVDQAVRHGPGPVPPFIVSPRNSIWVHFLWVPLIGACAIGSFAAVAHYRVEPHGDWDAVAMWNAKARFLALGGKDWTAVFSAEIPHSEYPLLLPATIACAWLYTGDLDTRIPFIAGLASAATACAVLVSVLAAVRGLAAGLFAGLALVTAGPVVSATASQYADVPLSLFMVSAVAALVYAERGGAVLLCAAGWLGGAAAATKNEGALFLVVLVVARAVETMRARGARATVRELGLLILAAIPGVMVQVCCKAMSGAENDLVAGQGLGATLARLTDSHRYVQIFSAIGNEMWEWRWVLTGLSGFTIAAGLTPRRRWPAGFSQCWVVVGLMTSGYVLIYLTTPHDLGWHLESSINRLAVQLWPLFLLSFFLTVNLPYQREGAAVVIAPPSA